MAYLREIERSLSLEKFNQTTTGIYQSHLHSSTSALREDSYNSFANDSLTPDKSNVDHSYQYTNRWSMIIKQKIYELEGPTFFYQYLFATSPRREVMY